MSFKRTLGPIGLMFTAISGIMGSAWLFGPYYAAQIGGPGVVIAWALGGLAMLIIALTFAELVTMLPIAGGNARFIYFTHGVGASFLFSWILWLGYAAVAPVETMGVLQYLSSAIPWLVTSKQGVVVLTTKGYGVAALLLLLLCVLNLASIRWLSRYNSVIVWFKLCVPILVALVLFVHVFHPTNFTHFGFLPHGIGGLASALSLGGIIFSYAGYAPAIVLAGEAKNPQKVVPLVLVGALGICMTIYIILQIAFIGAMSPGALSHGWAHLSFGKDASPFIGLTQGLHLTSLRDLIFLTAILAPFGTALIFVATSSRVAYAMSENGYFPHIFMLLSKKGVPIYAVGLNFIIGMALFFPDPGWQGMVGFLTSAFVLCYAIGPVALLSFRRQTPDFRRPYRLPWARAWCWFAFYMATLIVYWTGWTIYWHMMAAIVLGILIMAGVYLFQESSKKAKLQCSHAYWIIAYLIGLGVISFLSHDQHHHSDMTTAMYAIVLFFFSGAMLWWGVRSALPQVSVNQSEIV